MHGNNVTARETGRPTKNLIHIGYPKAGSTFLQNWFSQHPEFAYENGGIGGFYNLYSMTNAVSTGRIEGVKYFVTSFEGLAAPKEHSDKLWIDYPTLKPRTPVQCRASQKLACETLHSLFPDGKVLIVTRNFKGIILSSYSQYLRVGGRAKLADMLKLFSSKPYHHFINYNYLISLYTAYFGKENVIVLPYELLQDDQHKFLSVLEEKLGVSHAQVSIGVVNPSLTMQEQYWYRLLSAGVGKIMSAISGRIYHRFFPAYVNRLFHNRFDRVVKLMIALMPGKKVNTDVPVDVLKWCSQGEILKENPLYEPYKKSYLID